MGKKRLVFECPWQRASTLECYSDTDWGVLQDPKDNQWRLFDVWRLMIESWSSTQLSISLCSGEAEYYGVVKAAGIALGHQSLMAEMEMSANVRLWTDSSAAVGI